MPVGEDWKFGVVWCRAVVAVMTRRVVVLLGTWAGLTWIYRKAMGWEKVTGRVRLCGGALCVGVGRAAMGWILPDFALFSPKKTFLYNYLGLLAKKRLIFSI
jgi:hypothetical protein